ncbi:alpha-2Da adrenergic receptor-like [Dreissena polymorpha]|uniref:G-protein coupled receptors family 1 profile domain-containing protein n=1 Tax=Dreissena polymorpha TaxID=45954 RepID=A0A9D3Y3U6_DREPO|nr:alpha-2Da adrenergic receptor-like [Dreissena polymorpha]XP_052259059.1 alpha-2Da adrenergic receptor-like [Dreissena polymorpha]KAH3691790.1 hypothetical protein DPMN_192321 [Dreissena polymorpha]
MTALSVNGSTTLSGTTLTSPYQNVSMASKVVETTVLCVIISITIVGNVCLFAVVLRSKALRNLTNMFILGLSTADLLVGLTNMPITVYTIIKGRWEFSHSACVLFGFLNMITLVTSVLSLCNISINRYVMVCYPQKFKDIYTVRNSVFMIIGVVIFSILLSLPPLIGWSEYVYTPSHSFCFADWQNHMYYAFFMIGCCFGIPFMVMSVCNVLILRTVRASRLRLRNRQNIGTQGAHISTESNLVSFKRFTLILSFLKSMIEKKNKTRPADSPLVSNNNIHSETEASSAQTLSIADLSTAANLDSFHNTLAPSSHETQVISNFVPATTTTHTSSSQSPNSTLKHNPMNRLINENWQQSSEKQHPSRELPEPSISIETSSDVSLVVPSNSEIEINGQGCKHDVQMKIPKSRQPSSRRREEIRLAFSLTIIVVVFVICWLPYCISMLLSIFYAGHVPREFHMFTIIIGYANSCCNPIIYGVMNKRFKVGFQHIFCFWRDRSCT